MCITMLSDVPSKYTPKEIKADISYREAQKKAKERDIKIQAWLSKYPEIGTLNSGKFYVYPVGGEFNYIEAFHNPQTLIAGE